jgi:hypothetical protein
VGTITGRRNRCSSAASRDILRRGLRSPGRARLPRGQADIEGRDMRGGLPKHARLSDFAPDRLRHSRHIVQRRQCLSGYPMIELIVTIALVGLLVWGITTLIPMPPAFSKAIMVIGVVFCVLYVLSAFGLFHMGAMPRIR